MDSEGKVLKEIDTTRDTAGTTYCYCRQHDYNTPARIQDPWKRAEVFTTKLIGDSPNTATFF